MDVVIETLYSEIKNQFFAMKYILVINIWTSLKWSDKPLQKMKILVSTDKSLC